MAQRVLQSLAAIKQFRIPYIGSMPSIEASVCGRVMSSMSVANISQLLIKSGRKAPNADHP